MVAVRAFPFPGDAFLQAVRTRPAAPYGYKRKEARRYRIEDRNDRTRILITVGFGAVGAFYGVETSSSTLGALVASLCFGFVGAAVGGPLAFAINITRNWR